MGNKEYINTLAIAGIHSAGVCGLFADLKTFSALGCNGLGVPTLTVTPNEQQLLTPNHLHCDLVQAQLKMVAERYRIGAIKIGLLSNPQTVNMLAKELEKLQCQNLVLDLVLRHKTGEAWLDNQTVDAIMQKLIPLATIITPNLEEAELMLNIKLNSAEDVVAAARSLSFLRPKAVLIKDFKSENQVADCLLISKTNQVEWFKRPKLKVPKLLGAGCSLSSAIAVYLAQGFDVSAAVDKAGTYIQGAIEAGLDYDSEQKLDLNLLHHYYKSW